MDASRHGVASVCRIHASHAMQYPFVSTASKFMIDTGAGVIDADYRGVVFVLLFNHSDKDFEGVSSRLTTSSNLGVQ